MDNPLIILIDEAGDMPPLRFRLHEELIRARVAATNSIRERDNWMFGRDEILRRYHLAPLKHPDDGKPLGCSHPDDANLPLNLWDKIVD